MLSISVASATEDVQNDMQATNDDIITIDGAVQSANDNPTEVQTDAELKTLISSASDNDTIDLDCDYEIKDTTIIKDKVGLIIDGHDHILDGKGKNRILKVDNSINVTLQNIVFKNGYLNDSSGAAIWAKGCAITLVNCTFINNMAPSGGAFYANLGGNKIINCTFDSNVATKSGGAVNINGDGNTIIDDTFKNNMAAVDGGAIYLNNGNGDEIKNNVFINNSATRHGGAIYLNQIGVSILKNNTFIDNTASNMGGAVRITISNSNGTTSISENKFKNNNAENGGAINVATGKAIINSNNFTKCGATKGGAIKADTSIIIGNNFKDNTAKEGSDIFIYPNSEDNSQVKNNSFSNFNSNSLVTYGNVDVQDNEGLEDSFAGLQIMIKSAKAGKEIFLTSDPLRGDFAEAGIVIDNSITINGNNHILDGNQKGRIFDIKSADVTLKNIIFKNAKLSNVGAAIRSTLGGLTIINCTFINNQGTHGGALYAILGGNTIINCTFDSNVATKSGGAININEKGNTIIDNTFKDNMAAVDGGAIYLNYGNGEEIKNNVFISNSATRHGGAINLNQTGVSTLKNNTFIDNTASNMGGAARIIISNSNGKTTISNSKFESNTAENGGALHITGSNVEISTNEFNNNRANIGSAGSIHVNGDNVRILNNIITKSYAKNNGGAIVVKSGNSMKIQSNSISNSNAQNGGAIHVESGAATIDSNNFTKCSATNKGGAIKSDTRTIITGNNFKDNAAKEGSDIFIYPNSGDNSQVKYNSFANFNSNSLITYGNVDIQDNDGLDVSFAGLQAKIKSAKAGKEITLTSDPLRGDFAESGIVIQNPITINGNNHILDGEQKGRIFVVNSTQVTLKNIIFKNAKLSDGGAAILSKVGGLTIINCTFINNQAEYGGALYASSGGNKIINCTFDSNVATKSGGAVNIDRTNGNTIINNTFKNNIAITNNGGAVVITGNNKGSNLIKGSTFENNIAKSTAYADGGAIYLEKGVGNKIEDNEFKNNLAKIGGAVTLYESGYFTLVNNIFTDNTARHIGGALRANIVNSDYKTTISNNKFKSNTAENSGALHIDGSNVEINTNEFDGNKATQGYSGTMQINGNTIKILNNDISNTNAKTSGGAIVVKTGTSITIQSNNFTNAKARDGGAIHVESGVATIKSNNFIKCSASYRGGAIKSDTKVIVTENTFKDNTATDKGSDILIHYDGLRISQIKNNVFLTYTPKSIVTFSVLVKIQDNKGFKEVLKIETLNKNYAVTTTAKYLTVVLKNSKGTGVSGKTLTISLNGKTYTGTTDADGKFKTKIAISAIKKYSYTVKFAGDGYSYAAKKSFYLYVNKAVTKISSPAKTFKKSAVKKVVVTLKSGKKVLAKKKVSIKINGKTYKGTTNSRGKATIKIKITKKGSFKGTLKYVGNKTYKACTGKVTVKIK